jgi:hypothetical protein
LRTGHHGDWNNKGTRKQRKAALPEKPSFASLFLCCSAQSGREISRKRRVKARWKFYRLKFAASLGPWHELWCIKRQCSLENGSRIYPALFVICNHGIELEIND